MSPAAQQASAAGAWASSAVAKLDNSVSAFVFALNYRVTKDLAEMAVTVDDIKQRFAQQYSAELADINNGLYGVIDHRNKQLAAQLRTLARPIQQVNTRLQAAAAQGLTVAG